MTIHLRERPHRSTGSPNFARLGWGVTFVAVCLVGLGGGARLLMEPSTNAPSRASEYAARKKPARTAANAPAPAASPTASPGRAVRVIPTDMTPVASIAPPAPEAVVVRPFSRAFGEIQRAHGAAYQGFKVVAGH